MKKTILLFTTVVALNAYSQKIDSVSVINNSELSKEYFSDKKKTVKTAEYIFADLNSLKVGDVVMIGQPAGIDSNYNEYSRKSSRAYDNIMLGTPWGVLLKGLRYPDTSNIQDKKFKVEYIRANYQMGSFKVYASLSPVEHKLITDRYITIIDLDKSYKYGEVLLSNRKMTRDEAIKALEEKKKLIDLGLATQEEFEKLREELKPIIIGG